jgi:hypothetical protein
MSEAGSAGIDLSSIINLAKAILTSMLPGTSLVAIGKNKDIVTGTYTLRDFTITITVGEHKTLIRDQLVMIVELRVNSELLKPTALVSKMITVTKAEDVMRELETTRAILDSLAILIKDNPHETVAGWLSRKS